MKQIIINLDFPEIQALEKAGEKDAIIKVVYSEMNLLTLENCSTILGSTTMWLAANILPPSCSRHQRRVFSFR